MLPLFTTIATGIFLLFVNIATAQDSGGLSDAQGCLLNCSLNAVTASGCDVEDTPCICASAIYASNVTQCAEQSCSISASDVQDELDANCGQGSASGSASAGPSASDSATRSTAAGPSASNSASKSAAAGASASNSVSNSAPSGSASNSASNTAAASQQSGQTVPNSAVRTGLAAGSALGLVFIAFLV
ncbi:hypothetical protein DFH06DRAFT_1315648 [Mycena polygramma]|nr:hypothetical protein DFH06DRAFT_1315648 [Mycena polygramma]